MSLASAARRASLGAPVTLVVGVLLVAIFQALGAERDVATLFFAVHRSQLGVDGWFRLFTASGMHADFGHLSGNLMGLVFLGLLLEPRLGPSRYTCVLFGSALAAALITTGFSAHPSVGASGAVYGLLGALLATARMLARATGQPPPSLGMLGLLLALVAADNLRAGIDHWAHAGGAAGGALLGVLGALQRGEPSPGLRASALALAGVYVVAGGAGWAEYRFAESDAVLRGWDAVNEQAWDLATEVDAKRGDLTRARPHARDPAAHRGRAPLAAQPALRSAHHVLEYPRHAPSPPRRRRRGRPHRARVRARCRGSLRRVAARPLRVGGVAPGRACARGRARHATRRAAGVARARASRAARAGLGDRRAVQRARTAARDAAHLGGEGSAHAGAAERERRLRCRVSR